MPIDREDEIRRYWRRRIGGGTPADITAFIAAQGGNAMWPAFYDTRVGVVPNGMTASQWNDVRGSLFAPAVAQATVAKQPTWDAGARTLTGDGVNTFFTTPLSSLFDPSNPVTVFIVGAVTNGAYLAGIYRAAGPAYLLLRDNAGTWVSDYAPNTMAPNPTGVAAGGTRRVAFTGVSSTAEQVGIPNSATQFGTKTAAAPGNAALVMWDYIPSGGAPAAGVLVACAVYAGYASASVINAFRDWAIANKGAVAA